MRSTHAKLTERDILAFVPMVGVFFPARRSQGEKDLTKDSTVVVYYERLGPLYHGLSLVAVVFGIGMVLARLLL